MQGSEAAGVLSLARSQEGDITRALKAVEHAKHARDVELGKAPKLLVRPTKQQPALEEK